MTVCLWKYRQQPCCINCVASWDAAQIPSKPEAHLSLSEWAPGPFAGPAPPCARGRRLSFGASHTRGSCRRWIARSVLTIDDTVKVALVKMTPKLPCGHPERDALFHRASSNSKKRLHSQAGTCSYAQEMQREMRHTSDLAWVGMLPRNEFTTDIVWLW